MADDPKEQPTQRSAADKERSRQLSRSVDARDTGKNRGAQPRGAKGQRPKGSQPARGANQGGANQGGGKGGGKGPRNRQGAQRPPARRPQQSRGGGRSRTRLFTWGAVALVVVVVVVLVVVYSTSSKKGVEYTSQPVSASVLHDVTDVPASVFDKVGTGLVTDIHPPTVEKGQPALTYTGKPGMLALLGEFCPYCAAERWSIITAFSRFGTFSGLKTMQSSTTDFAPGTQTFTFATATYTSKYFTPKLREIFGQDKTTGAQTSLEKLTKAEARLAVKYDHSPTTTSGTGNSIPFMDFGNKVIFYEVSYTPLVLQGLSRTTIAAGLRNPKLDVTKLIIGTSNEISASICAIDGGKPGSVCSSSGVRAAAKHLNLSS
ncbi:MAG: DUF929 family protein [Acidimicrobiales bacterium]